MFHCRFLRVCSEFMPAHSPRVALVQCRYVVVYPRCRRQCRLPIAGVNNCERGYDINARVWRHFVQRGPTVDGVRGEMVRVRTRTDGSGNCTCGGSHSLCVQWPRDCRARTLPSFWVSPPGCICKRTQESGCRQSFTPYVNVGSLDAEKPNDSST